MSETLFDTSQIIPVSFESHIKNQYLAYAKDVILYRAIPDVRDGLKPVQRRIILSMYELGLHPNGAFKKSARTVGDVLGKYHPHGDSSVYEAMVNLAQDFNTKYPLVNGHGNFGSIDNDPAAAMRYTEAKLSQIGDSLMKDIEKTVDYVPNYDESGVEPMVLPGMFPTLLANGSTGIACGMAASFAPHKVSDVYKIIDRSLEKSLEGDTLELEEMIEIIQAPDFPTGGVIINPTDLKSMYRTGMGRITIRGTYHVEDISKKRDAIVFTEIPYKVVKSNLLLKIADLAKDKLPDITEVRDESDKDGIRLVVEVKKGANIDWIVKVLFKHTDLQTNFNVKQIAVVGGKPKLINLEELIHEFVKFASETYRRKINFEYNKVSKRYHIVEGIVKALLDAELVLKLIKPTKGYQEAVDVLKAEKTFGFSEAQAKAVAEIKIWNFNEEGRAKYQKELEELAKLVSEYNEILTNRFKFITSLREEIGVLAARFSTEKRLSRIEELEDLDRDQREFIKNEDIVVMLTHNGLIKAVKLNEYNAQNRAGKGVSAKTKEDDFVKQVYTLQTHDDLIIATNSGRINILPAYKIPIVSKNSVGKYINNFVSLEEGEEIIDVLAIKRSEEDTVKILLTTKHGYAKRLRFDSLPKRNTGVKVMKFHDETDKLISCELVNDEDDVAAVTAFGRVLRTKANKISVQGRSSGGVKLIKFKDEEDYLVSILPVMNEDVLLLVSQKGLGKRCDIQSFTVKGRATTGVIGYPITPKTGYLSGAVKIKGNETILVITKEGMIIRIPADAMAVYSRQAKGVKVVTLNKGDMVASITAAPEQEEEETEADDE